MKKFLKYLSLATIVFATYSCTKDDDGKDLIDDNNKWVYLDSSNSANVKFLQVFAGNTPQLPTAATATTGPQVFIYANGKKLNGTTLGYGGVFPITNVYANIPSGTTKFDIINGRLDLSVVPNVPKFIAGDTLASFTATLDKSKYYSIYIGDSVPFVRALIKEDIMTKPDDGTYKIRVANMLMNPLDTLTLFSARQNAEIISDITHKQVSNFVQVPVPIIGDTLIFRKKGTTSAYVQFNGFSPTPLRSYTLIARGKNGVTNKTPVAAFITNR
jgi:hypothetical protein